ncbi:MAG: outer membrane protein transport protein [Pseudomonadota bacterium]
MVRNAQHPQYIAKNQPNLCHFHHLFFRNVTDVASIVDRIAPPSNVLAISLEERDKMKKIAAAATTLGLATTSAFAGQIERDGDRTQILFEDGKNYVEVTASTVHLNVSGTLGPLGSGNIQESYQQFSFGYKHQLNEKLAFAVVLNSPVGADVFYNPGIAPYPFAGSTATVDSRALTGLAKYQVMDRVSIYGGLRVQALKGSVFLPPLGNYALSVEEDYKLGYVLGAAYEIPDIALRVAATYESKIEHDFRDNAGTEFDVEIPQAVTLNFQSGVAANTLVFGSIRWREWTEFNITPPEIGAPIAFGTSDIWTYELGVGRRFNENWSAAATLGYEQDNNDIVGNLQGTDGYVSYGLAVKYETETWELTTGIRYFDIGSTNTTTIGANFADNDAIAVGMKLGLRF